jgi:hypothetical protein
VEVVETNLFIMIVNDEGYLMLIESMAQDNVRVFPAAATPIYTVTYIWSLKVQRKRTPDARRTHGPQYFSVRTRVPFRFIQFDLEIRFAV